MKTAMQELFDLYEKHKKEKGTLYGFTINRKTQKKFLEKEKQQIIDANYDGRTSAGVSPNEIDAHIESANDYFNQTYKTKENDINR